ncbi:hypothetical protein K457DRAFT_17650 [Linnemannia elongata AG-77]|uniref:Uncharacterized protein n=1 Tax=Linnemannia elongata AG-77 TaxID=1314771 RepID=A0A197K3Y2_9FUNG|nr:hypothetical protein K457DRAFT_17650 [Linnemannia elongata AG-77]
MISKSAFARLVASFLGFLASKADAKKYSQSYDCYIVIGKIQRCYDGSAKDLTRCSVSSRLPSDQTYYAPRSIGGQTYPFGTSVVTLQTVDNTYEKVDVATFFGVCEGQ